MLGLLVVALLGAAAAEQCSVFVDGTLGVDSSTCGTGLTTKACKTAMGGMTAINKLPATEVTNCANITLNFQSGNYTGAGNTGLKWTPTTHNAKPLHILGPISSGVQLATTFDFLKGTSGASIWELTLGPGVNVTMYNLAFVGGLATYNGGAIKVNAEVDSVLSIFESSFYNNEAANGGAIAMDSQGVLRLNLCTFIGNTATSTAMIGSEDDRCVEGGGAVFAPGNGPLSADVLLVDIDFCDFSRNRAASACGGAVLASDTPNVDIDFSEFIKNQAHVGGAIFSESLNGDQTWNDNTFEGNEATDAGGAFFATRSTHTVGTSTMISNMAARGGAIFLVYSSMTVHNCSLTANEATYRGGGVYIYGQGEKQMNNENIFDLVTLSGNLVQDKDSEGANLWCAQSRVDFTSNPPPSSSAYCQTSCINPTTQTCACAKCVASTPIPTIQPPGSPLVPVIVVLLILVVIGAAVGGFFYMKNKRSGGGRSQFLNI